MTFLRKHPVVALIGVLGIVFMWLPIVVVVLNAVNADSTLVTLGRLHLDLDQAGGERPGRALGARHIAPGRAVDHGGVGVRGAHRGPVVAARHAARAARVRRLRVRALVLPAVVSATALFLIFTRVGLQLGMATTVIGQSVWDSAFATVILQARVRLLDPAVEEAAADLGARPASVFFRVTLPGLLPGILAAAVLAFSLSFDDVVTAFFLAGSHVTTLPLLIFGLIRFRVSPEVNAIGTS